MAAMNTDPRPVGPGRPRPAVEPLRILLVAPPMLPVPPPSYAGTERVVAALGDELHRRGHHVALVATGDSKVPYEHIRTIDESLWSAGYSGRLEAFQQHTIEVAWRAAERFDIVHAHMEQHSFVFAEHCPTPVITTLHGRLDTEGMPELLASHPNVPLVAISESQRRFFPDQRWIATIYHGLPLGEMPFRDRPGDYLAFVGRITPEKGIEDAIALSRATGIRLKVAAKVHLESEHRHFREVVQPAIDDGSIDFLGEVGPEERDPLYAGALATVMLGAWPEPFGLVAIESMATGTPVIARRAGALIETVIHGENGFIVDDVDEAVLAVERVGELDRTRIREDALARFSPARMTDEYEAAYRTVLADARPNRSGGSTTTVRIPPAAKATGSTGSTQPDHTGVDDASDEHRSPVFREPLTRA
jgi:glycosyltransferase involved in cell wall biosynthesis